MLLQHWYCVADCETLQAKVCNALHVTVIRSCEGICLASAVGLVAAGKREVSVWVVYRPYLVYQLLAQE